MKLKLFILYLIICANITFATDNYIDSIEDAQFKFLVQQIIQTPSCEEYYDIAGDYWKQVANKSLQVCSLPALPHENQQTIQWSALYILHGLYNLQFNATEDGTRQSFNLFQTAAQNDLHEAHYQLACLYNKGIGVEQNIKKGLELIVTAAFKGNIKAQEDFAHGYIETRIENYKSTFENLCIVCRSKRSLPYQPYHKYQLATYYFRGWGVSPDWHTAHIWLDQIQMANPELTKLVKIERERFPLGYAKYIQRKVPKDYKIVTTFSQWLEYQELLAKKFNNPLAQYLVATTYPRDSKCTQNHTDKSIEYFTMADKNNFAPATFSLGILLANEYKASHNKTTIRKYLTKALRHSLDSNEQILINENIQVLNQERFKTSSVKFKSNEQNIKEVELILKQNFFNDERQKVKPQKKKKTKAQKDNSSDIKNLHTSNYNQFIDSNKPDDQPTDYNDTTYETFTSNTAMERDQLITSLPSLTTELINHCRNLDNYPVQCSNKKQETLKAEMCHTEYDVNPIIYSTPALEETGPTSENLESLLQDSIHNSTYVCLQEETGDDNKIINSQFTNKPYIVTEPSSDRPSFKQYFDDFRDSIKIIKDILQYDEFDKNKVLEQIDSLQNKLDSTQIRCIAAFDNEYKLRQENFNLLKKLYPEYK